MKVRDIKQTCYDKLLALQQKTPSTIAGISVASFKDHMKLSAPLLCSKSDKEGKGEKGNSFGVFELMIWYSQLQKGCYGFIGASD